MASSRSRIAALLLAPVLACAGEDAFNRIEAIAVYGASSPKAAPGIQEAPPEPHDRTQIVTRRQVLRDAEPELRHLAQIYTGPELKRRQEEAWRGSVGRLVDIALALQACREKGLKATDEEVRAQVRRHMSRLGVPDERHLAEVLEAQGGTLDELKDSFRSQLLIQRYMDHAVKPPPPPSPDEILKYYAEHIAEFASPQEVQLRQIVLLKSRFPDRRDAEAKLRQLWSALQAGGDFAELARKESDSPSAEQGGLFPFLAVSSLRADLQELVRDVASGRTLSVQEMEESFAIIRIEGIRQGSPKPPSEAQAEILERILKSESEARRSRILQYLRRKAYVWTADP